MQTFALRVSWTRMRRTIKRGREFTPEFKQEAVALLENSNRPLMQIATELEILPSMLKN